MDFTAENRSLDSTVAQDPRLKPTPDYGSLGPSSDICSGKRVYPQLRRLRAIAAITAGILCALPFIASGTARAAWELILKA